MTDPQNAPQQPAWSAPQPGAPHDQAPWAAPSPSGYPAAPTGAAQTPPGTPQGYAGTPQGYPAPQSYVTPPRGSAAPPIQPWPSTQNAPAGPTATGNTLWAWLIGALAFVQILAYFVVDWRAVIELNLALVAVSFGGISPAAMSTYVGAVVPSLLLASVIAILCYATSVVFAFLDQRALTRMGVVRAFPWGWNFLAQPLVYVIGRTVVLSRNGRRGMGPLWLAIGGTVASWVISTVVTFSSFYNMG